MRHKWDRYSERESEPVEDTTILSDSGGGPGPVVGGVFYSVVAPASTWPVYVCRPVADPKSPIRVDVLHFQEYALFTGTAPLLSKGDVLLTFKLVGKVKNVKIIGISAFTWGA